jgi:hypothetical protein
MNFLDFSNSFRKAKRQSVLFFENQELFTNANHYYYEVICSTLLHLIEIHHNILIMFYGLVPILRFIPNTKLNNCLVSIVTYHKFSYILHKQSR